MDRIWRQRLEYAEFACRTAHREYQLAEPENRLVARQLEKDWEAALAERQRLGEEYDRSAAPRASSSTRALSRLLIGSMIRGQGELAEHFVAIGRVAEPHRSSIMEVTEVV